MNEQESYCELARWEEQIILNMFQCAEFCLLSETKRLTVTIGDYVKELLIAEKKNDAMLFLVMEQGYAPSTAFKLIKKMELELKPEPLLKGEK